MKQILNKKPRILILFSDTGGGHRSAAEAITEAFHLGYGQTIEVEMIDFFKNYAPPPFSSLPNLYPVMVRVPQAWGVGYKLSNGGYRTKLLARSTYPYVRRSLARLISSHPCDLVVSVHPIATVAIPRAVTPHKIPFITVVTDLVTTHAFWFNTKTELCLVPTPEAAERAIQFGMKPEQIRVVGLPVAQRFCQPLGEKNSLKRKIGVPENRPLILLIGGGEGMGPLENAAHAISRECPSVSLAIITGRNRKLEKELRNQEWYIPTIIQGFVQEMPEYMRAADILVTKAGPGTISEALIAGLPMILYNRLPGQEDGNVSYVVSKGAGIWASKPRQISSAINNLLASPEKYHQTVTACKRLARPQAARDTAQIIMEHLKAPLPFHITSSSL